MKLSQFDHDRVQAIHSSYIALMSAVVAAGPAVASEETEVMVLFVPIRFPSSMNFTPTHGTARGHAPSGRATMTPMRRKRVSQKGTLPLQAVSNRCPWGLRLRRQPRQLRLQRKGKSVKQVGSVFTIAPAKKHER
jgi:hypothetical protein